jgi:hypothetical protein
MDIADRIREEIVLADELEDSTELAIRNCDPADHARLIDLEIQRRCASELSSALRHVRRTAKGYRVPAPYAEHPLIAPHVEQYTNDYDEQAWRLRDVAGKLDVHDVLVAKSELQSAWVAGREPHGTAYHQLRIPSAVGAIEADINERVEKFVAQALVQIAAHHALGREVGEGAVALISSYQSAGLKI